MRIKQDLVLNIAAMAFQEVELQDNLYQLKLCLAVGLSIILLYERNYALNLVKQSWQLSSFIKFANLN